MKKETSQQRILAAAGRIFAQRGLESATTREIAREAGVNEVTLFRLFQNKERLKAAVFQGMIDQQAELLAARPPASERRLKPAVLRFAETYSALLAQNLALIRMLIGEIHRPREEEAALLRSIFQPLRAELIDILRTAQAGGQLRPGLDPEIVAVFLPEMILVDMLRRNAAPGIVPPYPRETHLAASVDVYLHGIVADSAVLTR